MERKGPWPGQPENALGPDSVPTLPPLPAWPRCPLPWPAAAGRLLQDGAGHGGALLGSGEGPGSRGRGCVPPECVSKSTRWEPPTHRQRPCPAEAAPVRVGTWVTSSPPLTAVFAALRGCSPPAQRWESGGPKPGRLAEDSGTLWRVRRGRWQAKCEAVCVQLSPPGCLGSPWLRPPGRGEGRGGQTPGALPPSAPSSVLMCGSPEGFSKNAESILSLL